MQDEIELARQGLAFIDETYGRRRDIARRAGAHQRLAEVEARWKLIRDDAADELLRLMQERDATNPQTQPQNKTPSPL